jgi:hypothetical protein
MIKYFYYRYFYLYVAFLSIHMPDLTWGPTISYNFISLLNIILL